MGNKILERAHQIAMASSMSAMDKSMMRYMRFVSDVVFKMSLPVSVQERCAELLKRLIDAKSRHGKLSVKFSTDLGLLTLLFLACYEENICRTPESFARYAKKKISADSILINYWRFKKEFTRLDTETQENQINIPSISNKKFTNRDHVVSLFIPLVGLSVFQGRILLYSGLTI